MSAHILQIMPEILHEWCHENAWYVWYIFPQIPNYYIRNQQKIFLLFIGYEPMNYGWLKWFLCWKLKGKKYVGYCYCEHIFYVFIISGRLAFSLGLPKHTVESISKMLSTTIKLLKVSHTHSVTVTITSLVSVLWCIIIYIYWCSPNTKKQKQTQIRPI